MERKELLGFIKNHEDLKQIIAEKEGKNYTNVKTTILTKYVDEYNNGCGGFGPYFTANLIAIDTRQHQIQNNQIGRKAVQGTKGGFAVTYNHGFKAFLNQIQGNQFCNILIIIYD